MAERHPGLKSPIAEFYATAACVCLDRHHSSPIDVLVRHNPEIAIAEMEWAAQDESTALAWANEIDTTEAGAYACIRAAVELMTGMVAVRRAETGSGADYYIGPPGSGEEDLEDCLRLEVSGTDRGTVEQISRRLSQKLEQARRGDSDVPAMAGVIGFLAQQVHIAFVEEAA